jgi:hypothetical protein
VPFTSGGIVPVHVTVTVCPAVDGTVIVLVGGVDAKLSIAIKPASEHKVRAAKIRGLNRPASDEDFLFIYDDDVEVGFEVSQFRGKTDFRFRVGRQA